MSHELDALIDQILALIEKQLDVLERQSFVSGEEMKRYQERLEEIMKLVEQLPPSSKDR